MERGSALLAPAVAPRAPERSLFHHWFARTIVLAPHSDDEVFCGGLIARLVEERCKVDVAVALIDEVESRTAGRVIRGEERLEELKASTAILGLDEGRVHVGFEGPRVRLDRLPQREIVSWIDALLEEEKPTAVLLPYPSHHIDHQILHDASRAALRHDPTGTVRFVSLWEYPYILTDSWGSEVSHRGRITFDITGRPMELKLRALRAHQSQHVGKPPGHLISVAGIKTLASLRGMGIGVEYGESYYLIQGSIL